MSPKLRLAQPKQELRALDPDLPFLATKAAIHIEKMLANKPANLSARNELADQLAACLTSGLKDSFSRSNMDPGTLTVLGEAVSAAVKNGPMKKIQDFRREAAKIEAALRLSSEPQKHRGKLEKARVFCLTLAKEALAYSASIHERPASHPFRG
jgi:hypothetical protein